MGNISTVKNGIREIRPVYGGARGGGRPYYPRYHNQLEIIPEDRRFMCFADLYGYVAIMTGRNVWYETPEDVERERKRLKITPGEVKSMFRTAYIRYISV